MDNIVILRDNINTEREEGRAEGRIEEKKESTRNLKKLGVAIDVISQATGLSEEEIENYNIASLYIV